MTTPKFDNYTIDGEQVINCDKTVDIPYDYDGYIATPITALDKSFSYSGLGMQLLFAEVKGGGKCLSTNNIHKSLGETEGDIQKIDLEDNRVRVYQLVDLVKDNYLTMIGNRRTYARLIWRFICEEKDYII